MGGGGEACNSIPPSRKEGREGRSQNRSGGPTLVERGAAVH